jgi:hypothetical protein
LGERQGEGFQRRGENAPRVRLETQFKF